MFRAFRDAKLRTKLLAIALVPLIGLAYFASKVTLERWSSARETERLAKVIELAVAIGDVVHETQRERGTTSGFVSSKGQAFGDALRTQREQTTRQLDALRRTLEARRQSLPAEVTHDVDAAMRKLGELEDVRARASRLEGEAQTFVVYYTEANDLLLRSLEQLAGATSDATLTRMTSAYVAFLHLKERSGMERAQLANAFTKKQYAPGQFFMVAGLIAEQRAYGRTFAALAAADALAAYRNAEKSEAFQAVQAYEADAVAAAAGGAFVVDSTRWFQAATSKIDALKEIESTQAVALRAHASTLCATATRAVISAGSIAAATTLVALLLTWIIVRSIARPIERAASVLEAVSRGDLTHRVTVESADEVGRMTASLNEALTAIELLIFDVTEAATAVSSAAGELASIATELSAGAQSQAAGLEETAAAMEQIATAARQNADSARTASDLASSARETADAGGRVAQTTAAAMSEVNDAAKNVASVIDAVDDLAFHIGLLSLNAAVEAARAGERGAGFNVIATEVRHLARRSSEASREIRTLIDRSVAKANEGSTLVHKSAATLNELVRAAHRVSDLVGDIALASKEQAVGVEQVTTAVSQIDSVTQRNATQTDAVGSTASSLATEAARLRELVGRFVLSSAPHAAE